MFAGLISMALGAADAGDGPSDEAWVRAAQRGDPEAFAALHRRHYTRIYRLAYLKTNHAADAEDIAGETFLRALAHLPKFRFADLPSGRRSLYPWLHRITLNLLADRGRRRTPAVTVSLDAPTAQGLRALLVSTDVTGMPQQAAERREVQQMVREAIASLPADQGEALIYRYLGDLALCEIAPLLGRTEGAARSLLHRAVVALRADLEKRLSQYHFGEELRDGRGTIQAGRRQG